MNNKYIAILVLIVLSLLSSCNESPVNSEQTVQFDSARYTWEKIDIPFPVREICAVDTNDIYFTQYDGTGLVTLKNRQFTSHSFTEPDFFGTCLGSINNTVYIGGNNTKTSRPMIQKWNGSSFENIVIPSESTYQLLQVYPMPNGDIWFSGSAGHILRISGSSLYHYFLDPDFYVASINILNGEIYCMGRKIDDTGSQTTVRVYKFQTGVWTIIKEEVYNTINPRFYNFPILNPMENHLYSIKDGNDIYDFDGSNFNKVLTLDSVVITHIITGPGINDFTFSGYRETELFSPGMGSIFNWNGNKTSVELKAYQTGPVFNAFYKNNSYLVLSSTINAGYANALFIGKRN